MKDRMDGSETEGGNTNMETDLVIQEINDEELH